MTADFRTRWAASLILVVAPCAAFAQGTAPITAVTLYPGGATVVRTASGGGCWSAIRLLSCLAPSMRSTPSWP